MSGRRLSRVVATRRSLRLLPALILMFAVVPRAEAQPRAGATEIALMGGWEVFGETENLLGAPYFSLRPSYSVTDWLVTEVALAMTPSELYEEYNGAWNSVQVYQLEADALFHFRQDWWTPYVSAGAGLKLNHEPDADFGNGLDADLEFGWALGAKFYLDNWIGLRIEARHRIAFDRAPYKRLDIWDDGNDGFNLDNTFHDLMLAAGVFFQVGASDADDDGIDDANDRCPDQAEDLDGYEDEDGCPDPDDDSDGVADALDRCRTDPEDIDGFQDEDGCPDLDNDADSILDVNDRCPMAPETINGVEDADGCPEGDADGDGLLDPQDACPREPEDKDGFDDDDGCPDTDNDADGIPDEHDADPNHPETFNGYLDEDGAPDEIPEALKQFTGSISGVNFRLGSADLTPASLPILRKAVTTLKDFPDLTVEVQGHTDSRGEREYNLELSRQRAATVRTFLQTAGVPEEQLSSVGFGPDRPIDEAETEAAWAKNRRVEFRVHK